MDQKPTTLPHDAWGAARPVTQAEIDEANRRHLWAGIRVALAIVAVVALMVCAVMWIALTTPLPS